MRRRRSLAGRMLLAACDGTERLAEVLRYVAAGTLRRAELRATIAAGWAGFAQETEAAPDAELFAWETAVYDRVLAASDRLLLIGAGSGRDLLALLDRGHPVDALELVPEAATVARARVAARGLRARIVAGSVEALPLGGTWDAVIFSWFCYSYLPESATRVRLLRHLRDRLAPGGRVIASYVQRPTGAHPALTGIARLAGVLTRSDWRAEDGDLFIRGPRAVRLHYQHHFAPEEIEAEALRAGYRVLLHERGAEPTLVVTPVGGAA